MDMLSLGNILNNDVIKFFREKKLIRRSPHICKICEQYMTEIKVGKLSDGFIWRCPRHKTQKLSIRKESFFELCKLPLKKVMLLLYLWAYQIPVTTACSMVSVQTEAAVQWYAYCRDACSWYLEQPQNTILMGQNGVVEVDESIIKTTKGNWGDYGVPTWVFGLFDRSEKIGHLEFIHNISANILQSIITANVVPGATIYTGDLGAYSGITQVPGINPPYSHEVVIHKDNFVDKTGIHTNNIQAFFKGAKSAFTRMNRASSTMTQSHLDEFLFRHRVKAHASGTGPCHGDVFNLLLETIAKWFPTP